MTVEIRKFESHRKGRAFKASPEAQLIVNNLPQADKEDRVYMLFAHERTAQSVARQVKRMEPGAVITVRQTSSGCELWAYNKYL